MENVQRDEEIIIPTVYKDIKLYFFDTIAKVKIKTF